MTYNEIVVTLVLAILLAGFVTEFLLGKLRRRGYGHISRDITAIARAIQGRTHRDSGDLVIRGSLSAVPVQVRFSQADDRPGLNIELPAAGNISLFCLPKAQEGAGGRVALPLTDPMFKSRFRLSSNHPAEAKLLFCTPAVVEDIQKLCCMSITLLALEHQRLELSELLIPEEDLSQHVLDCIRRLLTIAAASRRMPGEESERAMRVPRPWNWLRIAYIGVAILLLSSMPLVARLQRPVDVPQRPPVPSGIAQDEASQIPELQLWRLAQPGDFDPAAVAWLQQQGQEAKGSIHGAFAGKDREDSAYVLKPIATPPGDLSRLVVFLNGKIRFDANLPAIAIAARIPKNMMAAIEWRGRAPAGQPDGDGILVIQKYQDAASAIVLSASGVQLLTAKPRDFHSVVLR